MPPAHRTPQADPLSHVLEAVRLRGEGLSRQASSPRTQRDQPEVSSECSVYLVEKGCIELQVEGAEQVVVNAGGIALLPRGVPHTCSAGREEGGQWLQGHFRFDAVGARRLIVGLPGVIVIDGGTDPEHAGALMIAGHLLGEELESPLPGGMAMISRLLDLIFIRALRSWAARGDATPGWLAGCMDPQLAPAMAVLHADLARPWSVPDLAAVALMSRSSFADRFRERVGTTPGAYLQAARLAAAADLLRTTDASVATLAQTVGYASDAAFSRAFARAYDTTPTAWRRST